MDDRDYTFEPFVKEIIKCSKVAICIVPNCISVCYQRDIPLTPIILVGNWAGLGSN